jgi:predicted RNA-binding protein
MKKLLVLSLVLAGLVGYVAISQTEVFAFGLDGQGPNAEDRQAHRENKLQEKADFIGITVEELREAMENRTLKELLEEKGITREDMWEHMKENMIEHMRERGLTDDEISERIEAKEARMEEMKQWHEEHPDEKPPFGKHMHKPWQVK